MGKMYLPIGVQFVYDVERKHAVLTPMSEIRYCLHQFTCFVWTILYLYSYFMVVFMI